MFREDGGAAADLRLSDSVFSQSLLPGDNDSASYRSHLLLTWLPLADVTLFVTALLAGAHATGFYRIPILPALLASVAGVVFTSLAGGYSVGVLVRPRQMAGALLFGCLMFALVAILANLTLSVADRAPYRNFTFAAATAVLLLSAARMCAVGLSEAWSRTGQLQKQIAVVGINELSSSLIQNQTRGSSTLGGRIAALYRAPGDPNRVDHAGLRVNGDIEHLLEDGRRHKFDQIVIAEPPERHGFTHQLRDAISGCACEVAILTELDPHLPRQAYLKSLGGGLTLAVQACPLSGGRAAQKTVFDCLVASLLLVLLAPMFALIAMAIRWDTKGPVFFRQLRYGLNGELFPVWKFRTMHNHLHDPLAERQTSRDDPRVTRVGSWLRRTSLDELPQLFNVLSGSMSLVGPRPHAPGTSAGEKKLEELNGGYFMRYQVKPGMTGLAQINGCRGPLRSEEQARRRIAYDLAYIERWSFSLDLRILLSTALKGFVGADVY